MTATPDDFATDPRAGNLDDTTDVAGNPLDRGVAATLSETDLDIDEDGDDRFEDDSDIPDGEPVPYTPTTRSQAGSVTGGAVLPTGNGRVAHGSSNGRAHAGNGSSNGAATKKARRRTARAASAVPRQTGEPFFEYVMRPDVRPHVTRLSLTLIPAGGGKRPSIPIECAVDEATALTYITEPGHYEVRAFKAGGAFLASDSLVVTVEDLRKAKAARHDAATGGDDSAALRMLKEQLDDAKREAREARERNDRQREAHDAAMRELHAKIDASTRGAAMHTDPLEMFKAVSGLMGGGTLDAKQAEAIRAAAHRDGKELGDQVGYNRGVAEAMQRVDAQREQLAELRAKVASLKASSANAIARAEDAEADADSLREDLREAKRRFGILKARAAEAVQAAQRTHAPVPPTPMRAPEPTSPRRDDPFDFDGLFRMDAAATSSRNTSGAFDLSAFDALDDAEEAPPRRGRAVRDDFGDGDEDPDDGDVDGDADGDADDEYSDDDEGGDGDGDLDADDDADGADDDDDDDTDE